MFSEEFKPVAIKIEPTSVKKNESQLESEITAYIKEADSLSDISYYKSALHRAEEINDNYYRIAEIYRKIAMAYANLPNADKKDKQKDNDKEKDKEKDKEQKMSYLNRSSHYYKLAIKHLSNYYPVSMSEDEKKSIKEKIVSDRIDNHFLLARLYLVKQDISKDLKYAYKDLKYVYKAFKYAVKGLELVNEIAQPQNDNTSMSIEEHTGFNILDDCLNLLKNKKAYIPYYEKAINIFKALQVKYQNDIGLQLTVRGYESQLTILRRLPEVPDSLALPEKMRREASFGSESNKSNASTPLSHENTPLSHENTPRASISIFTFLTSPRASSSSTTTENTKEAGTNLTANTDPATPVIKFTLGGNCD